MAYRWSGSDADAEDLVQDVLIRLADRVTEMQEIEQLRPWLIKCVYRRFVDLHRSKRSNPVSSESDLVLVNIENEDYLRHSETHIDQHDDFRQIQDQDALHKALSTLDPDQRDVILLHDAEGYSASEVAEILDEKIGTIKSRLHRARRKLQLILDPGTF
jgi:RNA polymerase sigma-70 factor (ECF subfamily)